MKTDFQPSPADLSKSMKILGIDSFNWKERLKDLPSALINEEEKQKAFNWCKENFDYSWTWSHRLGTSQCVFYFENDLQLIQFTLKFNTLLA